MTLNAEKRLCCNFSVEGKARVKSGLTHTATANKLTMETGKNLGLRTAATRDIGLLWFDQTLPPKIYQLHIGKNLSRNTTYGESSRSSPPLNRCPGIRSGPKCE